MYSYQKERPFLFTEEGLRGILKLFAAIPHAVQNSGGVITCGQLVMLCGSGDSFRHLALIDGLVEFGYLTAYPPVQGVPSQHQVYAWRGPEL